MSVKKRFCRFGTVKQNAKHILMAIETNVLQMIQINDNVPTNTSDLWYRELKNLKSQNCDLGFKQSKNEEWIKVAIKFNCPIIDERKNEECSWVYYKILNFLSISLVREYPQLAGLVIYISEHICYPRMTANMEINFKKDVNLIFSKKILSDKYLDIKSQIEKILDTIKDEIKLIKSDNLAKSRLIESVNTSAYLKDENDNKHWNFSFDELRCKSNEGFPIEFWGEYDIYAEDYVVKTHKFPWMPVDMSTEDVPF